MALRIKRGDRVLLELHNGEIYDGTIEYFSANSVELYDIFCHTSNTEFEGNLFFYRNEVASLSRLEASSNEQSTSNNTNSVRMDAGEFARLKNMSFNFTFIDVFGKDFDDALGILNERESVGVVGLGGTSRGKPLSLLVLADFQKVYVFDLLCLGKLKRLQDVLESKYIVKVVHGGTALYDCLYHKYKIEMNNIFDTQIIDSIISEKEDDVKVERNISECLAHHFNFPPSLLSSAIEDISEKTWYERPLTKADKMKAVQLATYLPTLRDSLLELILKEYTNSINKTYRR